MNVQFKKLLFTEEVSLLDLFCNPGELFLVQHDPKDHKPQACERQIVKNAISLVDSRGRDGGDPHLADC